MLVLAFFPALNSSWSSACIGFERTVEQIHTNLPLLTQAYCMLKLGITCHAAKRDVFASPQYSSTTAFAKEAAAKLQ